MHTFAQKPKACQTTSVESPRPGRGLLGQTPRRILQVDAEKPDVDLTRPASLRSEHDFSRIPLHPPAAGVMPAKLAMNRPGDSYEHEADRIAENVMRAPGPQLQRACHCGGRCPKCHEEQPNRQPPSLQTNRIHASDIGQIAAPPIVHEVLRSPGQPLDPAARVFMEPHFGYDFSGVRVHTGAAAEKSAQEVSAQAYTVGHNIVFGVGRFAPGTPEGRRLIAHELTHVVQQRSSRPILARTPDDKEAAAIGSGVEPLELKEWEKTLEAQGYETFTRTQFDRVEWLSKAFSDKRARPDLVAINRAKRSILVGDITAGPWSQTTLNLVM